jgi:hypothetical protein
MIAVYQIENVVEFQEMQNMLNAGRHIQCGRKRERREEANVGPLELSFVRAVKEWLQTFHI